MIRIAFIFLFLPASVVAQVQSNAYSLMLNVLLKHSVNEIGVNDFKNHKDAIVLDVREENEFKVSHIENAIHIGYEKPDLSILKDFQKDQKIIVYCSVGYRSEKIAEKIAALGFTNVSNLYGGIFEWVNMNLPIVDNENNTTNRVHAYSKAWGVWLNKGEKVY